MKNLELITGNFNKEQKEFRKKYRDNVKGWYNGFVHLAMIFIIGGIGIYYFTVRPILGTIPQLENRWCQNHITK